jgi:hypothetical protein
MAEFKSAFEIVAPEDNENGTYVLGPSVVAYKDDNGEKVFIPTYEVSTEMEDDVVHVVVASINGNRYYPLDSVEDITVNTSKENITFSSYGTIYTVRKFQDTDGVWASALGVSVPSQALEERFMAEVQSAFSPDAPADDENLYAAVDDNTNEVKHLVYSCDSGLFIRDNGAWFKLPADDDSLDDLEVHEVVPKFIKIYDISQDSNDTLLVDDIEKYETSFRSPMTASAEVIEENTEDVNA